MDIKTGYFLQDGNAVNVILGFVPDLLEVFDNIQQTNPERITWQKAVADAGLTGQYGWTRAGTGTLTACADANNGIIAFDQSGNYVLVESPMPGVGKKATPVLTWAASASKTARSATAIGSIVRPAVRNGYVYECTGAGTTNDTEGEPTWPTTPGASVTETDGVIWTCRIEEVVRGGGKGFTFGATLSTDGRYAMFIAYRCDRNKYLGDAADGDLSII